LGVRAAIQHIRDGDIKAEFYVEQLIRQYDNHRNLNAVISIDETRVLDQARAVDRARLRGERLRPLAGLPVLIKDQIDVVGYPTTTGTTVLQGYFPKHNAAVVDAILRNGALVFAKTNLLSGPTSSNRHYGFVRNPYDLTRVPGGSSGGNGAAIAARIAPAGLGQDSGGSIRIPAAFCGIAGFRPSTGGAHKRYPDAGLVLPARSNDSQTIGPMARTVADIALLDAVITGEQLPALTGLRGLRIGTPSSAYLDDQEVDHGVAACMREAFARLRDAGAHLVEIDLHELINMGDELAPAFAYADRDKRTSEWLAQNVPGVTLEDLNTGRAATRATATQPPLSPEAQQELRSKAGRRYAELFRSTGIVAIAFPPEPVPAPPIQPAGDSPDDQVEVNGRLAARGILTRNTWWGARLGAPGLVIPAGLVSGLPVGLELESLPGDDGRLLALGIAVEKLLGPLPPPPFLYKPG
jgi:mandelamide amidase